MSIFGKTSENAITKYEEYPYIVYVRVSTDKDEQKDSVPNQIDICRYWLERNKYEWQDNSILKDEGKSGTLFLERTAMQLILKKARNREIKMVVFKSISRLARDLKDALEIKEILLGHGVRVVTIEEGYDSLYEGKNDMKFEMFSMFAAQYPKTQSVSISAALAAKVRRGDHIGKVPYGYRRVNQKLEIKEDEAEVIRKIFKWYNEDKLGYKMITHKLNEGIEDGSILPPKNKDKWQLTTVQRIIQNPTFCGTFILNQYTKIKVDGRKKQIKNPPEKWTIFENHHPSIISKEEWEKANNKEIVQEKKKVSPWNEFRGLIKCGECGSNMVTMSSSKKKKDGTKTSWRYLKCSAYRRGGHTLCVNHTPIIYEDFKEYVMNILIQKGKEISLNFSKSYIDAKQEKIKKLEKLIKQYNEKKKALIDLYLDKLISKAEFQVRNNEFNQKIKKAEDKLYLYNKEETHQKEIKNIQEAFRSLQNNDEDIHFVLKKLIERIVIHQDGKVDIYYKFSEL
jgi:site-specific DNA recombinase